MGIQAVTDDFTISKLEQWRESLGVNALQTKMENQIKEENDESRLSLLNIQADVSSARQKLDDEGILKNETAVYFDAYSEEDQTYYMYGGNVVYNAFNAKMDMDGFPVPKEGVSTAPVDGAYLFFFRGLKAASPCLTELDMVHQALDKTETLVAHMQDKQGDQYTDSTGPI